MLEFFSLNGSARTMLERAQVGHVLIHACTCAHTVTFCGHALRATVGLCQQQLPKIYYFHMVLIHLLTAKSSMETMCECACVCV